VKKILFLATTTGYQTRMFGEAAERLGVKLLFATDRCDQLDDPWWDRAIPIRFHQEAASIDAIMRAVTADPPDGVIAVGDRATRIAAFAATLLGLPGHPPEAAAAARDKHLTRERLHAAGLPAPWYLTLPLDADPKTYAARVPFPVVVKPLALSGSRGVMRADTPAQFVAVFERLQQILHAPDVRVMHDAASDAIQVESFIDGTEYSMEGLLHHGVLHPLALFDKPEPLDGPFFEETLYITPSRASESVQLEIRRAVGNAARALGLFHGPVHAECRVNERGVFVLEVAARPIGGLCARALEFDGPDGARAGLEELLLRHALGESPDPWMRVPDASGVMMIPIPRAGIYRRTDGVDEARRVPGVWHVQMTAKTDQQLVPLPEGASYLGFIFAKGDSPEIVEEALRTAHACLTFVIDRSLPIADSR
jgi:biotin carboxylase